jgi:hypothetical protein
VGIFDHKKFVADHNREELRRNLVDEQGYTEEDAELMANESIPEPKQD